MTWFFVCFFSHGLCHSNLEIVGQDETNLGMPCATPLRRRKKEICKWWAADVAYIWCYKVKKNAAEIDDLECLEPNYLRGPDCLLILQMECKKGQAQEEPSIFPRHLSSLGCNWRGTKLLWLCLHGASAEKLLGLGKYIFMTIYHSSFWLRNSTSLQKGHIQTRCAMS